MNNEKDLVVIFTDKAESVFSDILKNHGLEETDEEFDKYISGNKESKEMIIRNALTVIAQKKVPEEKLVELLQINLNIPKESVEKLLKDIQNQLLPLLLMFPEEKLNDPDFREEVSMKIRGEEKGGTLPYLKKAEIISVEENEKKMKREGKTVKREVDQVVENVEENAKKIREERIGKDTYREPIE